MQKWRRKLKNQTTATTNFEDTDIITMQLAPEMKARIRALCQYSGQDDPATMVSICIALVHSLMRQTDACDGVTVDANQLKFALSETKLVVPEHDEQKEEVHADTH